MGIWQPLKFRQRRRLFGAGHGGDFKDDSAQFLLGNSLFATEDREQPQAAKKEYAKAHGFSRKRCLYFLDFTPMRLFVKVSP